MLRNERAREKRVLKGFHTAARRGAKHVRENMPVAFGELKNAVRAVTKPYGAAIEVDAPHAEAVEKGSRPHWPPLAPILAWVKLRGMQGLRSDKQLARARGTTTVSSARLVARQISDRTLTDGSDAVAADAPLQIARAIQATIGKYGTKPHWFMRNAEPFVLAYLQEEVDRAVQDP